MLETPLAVAKIWVIPGERAVAVAWFVGKLNAVLTSETRLTTDVLVAENVNGPTLEVISVPWLKACASTVIDWVCERQGSWTGRPFSRIPLTVMLSMGGCTKTYTGMLLAPRADAVTVTGPELPGVQAVKLTSHWPAQATPLGARVKIEVLLEVKLIGVAILVPEVVCADAVKLSVAPRSSEVTEEGERLTRPGKMGAPAFLPPPHPLTLHNKRIATADHKAFRRNLPMHPSLNLVPTVRGEIAHSQRGMNWKNCSVEAGGGISKLRRLAGVSPQQKS